MSDLVDPTAGAAVMPLAGCAVLATSVNQFLGFCTHAGVPADREGLYIFSAIPECLALDVEEPLAPPL
eukprot:2164769-Pyramimonas_sp.AAC.1